MEIQANKQRKSSIELLRIIAIIGVVILHYNNKGMGGGLKYVVDKSLNQKYLFFTESLFICAVNLFIMISGYFLSCTQKRKPLKVVELVVQVILFKIMFYIVNIALGQQFSLGNMILSILPANYFVMLYCTLYIISPYINILTKTISKENFKKLVLTLFIIFSLETILVDFFAFSSELSTISLKGSLSGYSIVNFVLVYTIGAYIRTNQIKITKKQALLGIFICLAVIFLQTIFENRFFGGIRSAWNYNHPAAILMPVFIILLFNHVNFESKTINELAKATFTCFLFHGFFMPRIMVERFVNGNIFLLIIHQFGSAILLYLASYLIYKIYAFITKPLFKWLSPKIDILEKYIY